MGGRNEKKISKTEAQLLTIINELEQLHEKHAELSRIVSDVDRVSNAAYKEAKDRNVDLRILISEVTDSVTSARAWISDRIKDQAQNILITVIVFNVLSFAGLALMILINTRK